MKVVIIKDFGGVDQLEIAEREDPLYGAHDILVRIHATALNRADTLQRKGLYPPPPGESDIMGLEMAGEIIAVGGKVSRWKIGDRVCGLLGGGGYATKVNLHEDMALPIPENFSFEEAAAIPEAFLTAFQAIKWLGDFKKDDTVLIHAGASGVGTAGIQIVKALGGKVFVTASAEKHDLCYELGADLVIDYKKEDFEQVIAQHNSKGVHLIVDFIGAPYFERNIKLLGVEGKLVILSFLGGGTGAEIDLTQVLRKRLQIIGSTLRARSLEYKIALTQDFKKHFWALFQQRKITPVIDKVFSWEQVGEAHTYMESNLNKGKIVLKIP